MLLLFAVLLVVSLRQISDPDIWFNLLVGREIVDRGSIPTQEFYLFPALGEAATFSAWGFGLLHYLAFVAAGYAGMALLNSLLIAAALTLIVRAALPQERQPLDWALLLCVVAAAYACLDFRLSYRPESTLYLFLGLEILLLERWLADGRLRPLLLLPLLGWGITQLHTTAVLLVLAFGAYLCHWLVEKLRNADRLRGMQLLQLASIFIAMALLPLLNPNGVPQVTALFRVLGESAASNVEYLPVWQTPYRWHFLALACAAGLAWLLTPGRRLVDALLLLGFGWLAYRYVRNLGLLALVAVIPLTRALVFARSRLRFAPGSVAARALAMALAILGASSLTAVSWASGNWGIGIRDNVFFTKAVETIRQVSPGGNVMNFFHHGAYLVWALGPNYRAAVDGHFVRPSYADSYHDRVMRADPDWQALLARYDVSIIVTPATLPYSGYPIPLVERLAEDPRWRLLGVEAAGLLFVHERLAAGMTALDKRQVWQQMQGEGERLLLDYPGHPQALRVVELAQRRLRDFAGAE